MRPSLQNATLAAHTALAIFLVALSAPPAQAGDPVSIDGISLIDRGRTGEIVLDFTRGGLTVLDYDSDGFMDLVVGDDDGNFNRLYHNEPDPLRPGERTFVDVTAGSGLGDLDGFSRNSIGIVAADYDNDGDTDIFMVGQDETSHGLLYRNEGDGTFTNVSVASGVRASGYDLFAAAWADFDLDGDLDLIQGGLSTELGNLFLLENNGDGTFSDATSLLPPIDPFAVTYAMVWHDYDLDGWLDCFVAACDGPDVALKSVSDGMGGRRFDNVATEIGFVGLGVAPMGITVGDYDADGFMDLALSNAAEGVYFAGTGDSLETVTPITSTFGWGVTWSDVENDGDLDLFMVGSFGLMGMQARVHNKLFRNLGGGLFDDVSDALNDSTYASRFAARIDYDNDGLMDFVVLHPGSSTANPTVQENVSDSANHWIQLDLRGDGIDVNTSAVGALVQITAGGVTQVREIASGSSTTSTEDPRAHFGLGAATQVDQIEVIWPRAGSLALRTELFHGPFAADQILSVMPNVVSSVDGLPDGLDQPADDHEGVTDRPDEPTNAPALVIHRTHTGSTLSYELAAAADTEVQVFDTAGRLIRRLWTGAEEAGTRTHVWNERTSAGLEAPSGIYIARLNLGSRARASTTKIVVLR